MHMIIGFRWIAVHEQNREGYSISKSELRSKNEFD